MNYLATVVVVNRRITEKDALSHPAENPINVQDAHYIPRGLRHVRPINSRTRLGRSDRLQTSSSLDHHRHIFLCIRGAMRYAA